MDDSNVEFAIFEYVSIPYLITEYLDFLFWNGFVVIELGNLAVELTNLGHAENRSHFFT